VKRKRSCVEQLVATLKKIELGMTDNAGLAEDRKSSPARAICDTERIGTCPVAAGSVSVDKLRLPGGSPVALRE
jgi:hypothetical protein